MCLKDYIISNFNEDYFEVLKKQYKTCTGYDFDDDLFSFFKWSLYAFVCDYFIKEYISNLMFNKNGSNQQFN